MEHNGYATGIKPEDGRKKRDSSLQAAEADAQKAVNLLRDIVKGNIIHDDSGRQPDGFSTFMSYYEWLPGNIFIGPTNRSDDKGNVFEFNAMIIVENNNIINHRKIQIDNIRYKLLFNNSVSVALDADRKIDAYMNNGELQHSIDVLKEISGRLASMAGVTKIYQMNSSDWIYKDKKYRIRVDQENMKV